MMVSFIDHYNPISVDRFPSKTKIGKKFLINDSLLLRKRVTPEFSSAAKTFFIKNKHFSESHWWEYTKCCFKENSNIFSKNSITQENITILRLKQDYKKEKFKPEIEPKIKNLQDEIYQLGNK